MTSAAYLLTISQGFDSIQGLAREVTLTDFDLHKQTYAGSGLGATDDGQGIDEGGILQTDTRGLQRIAGLA